MLLEICVESADSARSAEKAGADRLELCSALDLGGLTPSLALIKQTRAACTIPLHVLIRPRRGDFYYNDSEFELMRQEIRHAKEAGADGVVIGILTASGEVDTIRTSELIRLAKPLKTTFHRAIDFSRDILQALEAVIACGADSILSSGGENSALKGAATLAKMAVRAADRIQIMPGAGINSQNAVQIATITDAKTLHFSASRFTPGAMQYKVPQLSISDADEYNLRTVNIDEITKIRSYFT